MKRVYAFLVSIVMLFTISCIGKNPDKKSRKGPEVSQTVERNKLELPPDLERYRDVIEQSIKPCIQITGEAGSTKPWESKFSGNPYFPINLEYPQDSYKKPMKLLAQINFEEIPDIGLFPATGILEFFISICDGMWGMDFDNPVNQDNFRVIYIKDVVEDTSNIITDFSFAAIPDDCYSPANKEAKLSFTVAYKPVSVDDFQFEKFFSMDNYAFFEQFGDNEEALHDFYTDTFSASGHKLGGYAFFTQTDPRSYGNSGHDILLLQIDSDKSLDILWGDLGVANFFIKKADLENLSFSNVLYNWDCY